MEFIQGNKNGAAQALYDRIYLESASRKRILWLISGGSNISIASKVSHMLKDRLSKASLERISIMLTDERYGPVGHADSNWRSLIDAGFDMDLFDAHPSLTGGTFEETVSQYRKTFETMRDRCDVIIGQFGVGTDCHIAGILPNSAAVKSKDIVEGYIAPDFIRITLTLSAIKEVDVAFAFAFGEEKRQAIDSIRRDEGKISDKPGLILRKISESYLLSDEVWEFDF